MQTDGDFVDLILLYKKNSTLCDTSKHVTFHSELNEQCGGIARYRQAMCNKEDSLECS